MIEIEIPNEDSAMKDVFEGLKEAMKEANDHQETDILFARANELGLIETPPVGDKMMRALVLANGNKSVRLEHRWYDGSKAFSIRPDVNIFELSLWDGESCVVKSEIRFPDKYV